jgi:hypothetical protein
LQEFFGWGLSAGNGPEGFNPPAVQKRTGPPKQREVR